MKFSKAFIGKKWKCPICWTRLEVLDPTLAFCAKCNRRLMVLVEAFPDPNGKTGRKECGSKVPHDTEESAWQHCKEVAEKPDLPHRVRNRLCIYLCRICSKWHVGHKGGKKQKVTRHVMLAEIAAK